LTFSLKIEACLAINSAPANGQSMMRFKSNGEIPPCRSVVLPIFNEGTTIAQTLEQMLAKRLVQEGVVVDDVSRDNTWAVLQSYVARGQRIKLFRHEQHQSKGAALRTGFSEVSALHVLVQDADPKYDPSEGHMPLEPVLAGMAEVVFSSRFQGAKAHRGLYFRHSLGTSS
jgi:cellulose synthase/poly-beta-1,6-N-acetylglucosamine synthase-like glycosyltransferase